MVIDARREPEPIPEGVEEIASEVVDAAVAVHRNLGPGLFENLYQQALTLEFERRGLEVSSEVPVRASYLGVELERWYRLDLLVEEAVIIEIKAVEKVNRAHEAQILTYLSLADCRLGFLLNFHAPLMKDGIHRRVLSPFVYLRGASCASWFGVPTQLHRPRRHSCLTSPFVDCIVPASWSASPRHVPSAFIAASTTWCRSAPRRTRTCSVLDDSNAIVRATWCQRSLNAASSPPS